MRTIEYQGVTVTYDDRCPKSYKWVKALNSGDEARATRAISRLLCGRDEYYAYLLSSDEQISYEEWEALPEDELDASMGAMAGLLAAVMEDIGQTAKN
jgi:hypothetical protein